MRVFLDANILFSAAKSNGAIRRLLVLLCQSGHELVADEFVVEEARRNLQIKARSHAGDLDRVLGSVEVHPPHPLSRSDLPPDVKLPEKDRPVLGAAVRLGCEALVTGDRRHFGALFGSTVGGVAIHSPSSLAESAFQSRKK